MEIITNSPKETKKAGESLSKEVLKRRPQKKAVILAVEGNLGGGKTTFLQGFSKGLGIKEKITSPTFIIMRRIKNFYHLDCYRVQKPEEILDLGWREIINNPKNIVAVEWADKIKKILPKNIIMLRFSFLDKNKRKIVIESSKNG